MKERIPQTLEGVSRTLLMTLYVRARETQRPDGMLRDERALRMVKRLECDFSRLRMQRHDEVAVILRMRRFDDHVHDFLKRNPEGVVVHIGCGLDTRFDRVDNGQVEWFDLDMPDVIALRKKLIDETCDRHHLLAGSVFEDDWFADVAPFQSHPFLFMAEGVLPYFEGALVRSLFIRLQERFTGSELVCDAHTPFVVWADNLHLAFAGLKARLHWSIKTGKDPESWNQGITMLDEWNYYDEDEENLKAFRWVRMFPALAKSSGIYHYRLG